jgi:hypothetical protein
VIEAGVWVYEEIDLKEERFTLQEIKRLISCSQELLWSILDLILY